MKSNFALILLFVSLLYSSKTEAQPSVNQVRIIPDPSVVVPQEGTFEINSETTYYAPSEVENAANFLEDYLKKGADITLKKADLSQADVVFTKVNSISAEGYTLTITDQKLKVAYADATGAFYAVQTLRQLLPAALERSATGPERSVKLPQLSITDAPKFEYRGMHLDVARHFFPKEFIKDYISYLAMLKMNTFHWHLTDDQGWRIEIDAYPRLTEKAAYRNETLIGHYNEQPQKFDGKRYGGYYTKDEVKEIVAFAKAHHVTIIPEIEMPGHAQAAISAYPELGCGDTPVEVATTWGVFENIFCPNEETFTFLETVLDEVIALFPGEYLHIGGDEAPKTQWKSCAHCQALIEKHNLKDEHGLQSWFIKQIETYVNGKGRKIIGWDEILEGGLAPNATVMSWRGTEGAVAAARQGNDVILSPTSHAYFDYYQDDHPDEPTAIGGYLPLQKVYSFNPIPKELEGEAVQKVLGAQGNLWTEYVTTTDQVEYMLFPRILAMAEVVWSGPAENSDVTYPLFLNRVARFMKRLDAMDIHYANHLYDIEGELVKNGEQIAYHLNTPLKEQEIRFRLNDTAEHIYQGPISISTDTKLEAQVYQNGKKLGRPFLEHIRFHLGVGGAIALNVAPHKAYSAGGKEALINGVSGSDSRYGDKEWLGFWGDDVTASITLKTPAEVSKISTRVYHAPGQWIHAPRSASVRLYAQDGSSEIVSLFEENGSNNTLVAYDFETTESRHKKIHKIDVILKSAGTIPEGQQGAGNPAWTFIDEIIIE